jgi:hypothetical protein
MKRSVLARTALAMAASALGAAVVARADDAGTPPVVHLDANSTLTQWKAADADDRSRVAVEIARGRIGPDADRLALAKAAMEITGCLSRTATDPRFGGWKVGPTAATCLSAPEFPTGGKPE